MAATTSSAPEGWPSGWPSLQEIQAVARAIALHAHDAGELAGAAIEKALQQTRDAKLEMSWFKRVMRNFQVDIRRKDGVLPVKSMEGVAEAWETSAAAPTPEEEAIVKERIEILLRGIGDLDPEPREVIQLTYFEGLRTHEIAERVNLSPSTVERHRKRALDALFHRLKDDNGRLHSGFLALAGLGDEGTRAAAAVASSSPASVTSSGLGIPKGVLASLVALMIGLPIALLIRGAFVEASPSVSIVEGAGGAMDIEGDGRPQREILAVLSNDEDQRRDAPLPGVTESVSGPVVEEAPAREEGAGVTNDSRRQFRVRLEVNGAAGQEWRAFTPTLGRPAADQVLGEVVGVDEDACEFSFALPDGPGPWSFRFVHGQSGQAVWLRDDGRSSDVFHISFRTVAYQIPKSVPLESEHAPTDKMLLMCNSAPGVWVATQLQPDEESPSGWAVPAVCVGQNRLVSTIRSMDPDQWRHINDVLLTILE